MYDALIVVNGEPLIIPYKTLAKHIEGFRIEIVARDFWRIRKFIEGHGMKIMRPVPVGGIHGPIFAAGRSYVWAIFKSRNLKDRDLAILDLCRSLIRAYDPVTA